MELYSLSKTAGLLGVKVRTLRGYVQKKEIPYYRIGGLIKFNYVDIMDWVEKRKISESESGHDNKP